MIPDQVRDKAVPTPGSGPGPSFCRIMLWPLERMNSQTQPARIAGAQNKAGRLLNECARVRVYLMAQLVRRT